MTTQYSEFFLGSNSKVAELETLEISHPNLSRTYWIVRNKRDGLIANLEDGSTSQAFEYYPLRISQRGARADLDQGFSITVGDLGQTLPDELDAIAAAGGFAIKPLVKYRTYRSDYLTLPLYGPVKVQIKSVGMTSEGSILEAVAPGLNSSKTGELYRIDRFPMLRGLL
jgi:hypothetical protein